VILCEEDTVTSGYSQVLVDEGRHGFELIHKSCAAEEL
jgi:hypothetical protein